MHDIVRSLPVCLFVFAGCVASGDDVDPDAATRLAPAVAQPSKAAVARVSNASIRTALGDHAVLVEQAAARYGVEPSLVAAVVLVESNGDPTARSPIGARGLMQLMPATAQRIADERHLAGHTEDRLDDPAYNLDLGVYHLAQLIDALGDRDALDDDAVELAAAAYNGGIAAVEAWQAGSKPLSEETTSYKAAVLATWRTASRGE